MMIRPALAIALLVSLHGCASLSESDCRNANWELIGYEDGAKGAQRSRRQSHAEACAEYGIRVDDEAWQNGYEQGLDAYCTPENAVRVGLDGGDYNGVCPPETDLTFSTHWRVAREVFEQRRRVALLDERRRTLEYALADARNDDERRNIRYELSRLDNDLRLERDRLMYEERRLHDFMRGIR